MPVMVVHLLKIVTGVDRVKYNLKFVKDVHILLYGCIYDMMTDG